ncbi:hypothetical protein HYU06_03775 [Candidatus Woesearchaeota archaeon]|nr:hypothetical protein [Candidatus Woesearchaeota archaeon]
MVIIQNKISKPNVSKKIVDNLRAKKDRIISKEEVFQVIKDYERIYRQKINILSLWTYLRKSRYINRVLGDYYYIYSLEERHGHYCRYSEEELVFLVLQRINICWYLGLERALIENKVIWQALNLVPVINARFSGNKVVGNTRFKFIKTKKDRFNFGIMEKHTNNNVRYFYSDLERTYLDFLYFGSYEGKDIKSLIKSLDFKIQRKKLGKYAGHYSKKIMRLYGKC